MQSSFFCLLQVVLTVASIGGIARADAKELIGISADQKGFEWQPSGKRFTPWGHNYGSVDILDRLRTDPARVERDFADMRAAGTTVARVHPEMPLLMAGPRQMDPHGIALLERLLSIAEKAGIYLDVTGLACYKIKDRMAWYDALSNQERWQTQEYFWENLARTCSKSSAVFCYCLINEPAASGSKADGWYAGRMGDVEFCQRLWIEPGTRTPDEIFAAWTAQMTSAIRRQDPKRLITLGMLPFPGAYKAAAPKLDFACPHLYPKTAKVREEIALLKQFDFGKPIVIEETFPLSCGTDDLREFLLKSRSIACGWIGHWPDDPPARLLELKNSGKATIGNVLWLSWVDLFKELGPQMNPSNVAP